MTQEMMRGFVRAFCDALSSHDPQKVAPFLDENVDWTVFGPVDLFPFFGQRRGKAAVLAMLGEIGASLTLKGCEQDTVLFDGPRAAALTKITAVSARTGRTLSLRLAHFAQFEDGKLVRLRVVFDTLDAAEQVLGREFDLSIAA
jgi:ketosteroid isomerase-like protein